MKYLVPLNWWSLMSLKTTELPCLGLAIYFWLLSLPWFDPPDMSYTMSYSSSSSMIALYLFHGIAPFLQGCSELERETLVYHSHAWRCVLNPSRCVVQSRLLNPKSLLDVFNVSLLTLDNCVVEDFKLTLCTHYREERLIWGRGMRYTNIYDVSHARLVSKENPFFIGCPKYYFTIWKCDHNHMVLKLWDHILVLVP